MIVCCIKGQRGRIDKGSKPSDDGRMDPVSKELLDARLETIETRMDGRIATLEVKIDGKFSAVDAKFAELRTEIQKGFADLTKWIVGTVIGVAAVTITIMTFVLNNAVPKAPAGAAAQPASIVASTQPEPSAPIAPLPGP